MENLEQYDGSTTESEYYDDSDDAEAPHPQEPPAQSTTMRAHATLIGCSTVEVEQQREPLVTVNEWNNILSAEQLHIPLQTRDLAQKLCASVARAPPSSAPPHLSFISPFASLLSASSPPAAAVSPARSVIDLTRSPPREATPTVDGDVPFSNPSSTIATSSLESLQSQPPLACGCCAHIPPIQAITTTSDVTCGFCFCCRRLLPTQWFSNVQRKLGVRQCCRVCRVSEAPVDVLRKRIAELPLRVQHDTTIEEALRNIQCSIRNKKKLAQKHTATGQIAKLLADPRVKRLDEEDCLRRVSRQMNVDKQQEAIKQDNVPVEVAAALFREWIQSEDERLGAVIQRIKLYVELLRSRGVPVPKHAKTFLATSTHLFADPAAPVPSRADQVSCGTCTAFLDPTPRASQSTVAFCDCCLRMVPKTLLAPVSAKKQPATTVCQVCHAARQGAVECGPLAPLCDTKWLSHLSSAIHNLKTKTKRTRLNPSERDLADRHVDEWRQEAQNIKTQQQASLLKSATSVAHSRIMYDDHKRVQQQLAIALERAVFTQFETLVVAADPSVQLPKSLKHVAQRLYAERKLRAPSDLFEDVNANATKSCGGCGMQLASVRCTQPHKAAGFCDCCRRILPTAVIAETSSVAAVSACTTCIKSRSLGRISYELTTTREAPQTVSQLFSLADKMKHFLQIAEGATGLDPGRVCAELELKSLRKRWHKQCGEQQRALHHGKVITVELSQLLYKAHVQIGNHAVEAALKLLRMMRKAAKSIHAELPNDMHTAVASALGPCDVAVTSGKRRAQQSPARGIEQLKRTRVERCSDVEEGEITE